MASQPENSERPKTELLVMSPANTPIPAVIADCGDKASERFFTFFIDTIRNKNECVRWSASG
jgi:hypothetical protein